MVELSSLKFSPLTEYHLEWARCLHNDPEVLCMLTDPHKVSREEQIDWFSNLQESKTSKRLVVSYKECLIGIIRLDQIDYNNKSVQVGLDIHKDFRGGKFAKPIYNKLLSELFVEFNRVYLMVAEYNRRAINLYSDLGFKYEGTHRQALFRYGKFHDYISMSILREEYNDTTL